MILKPWGYDFSAAGLQENFPESKRRYGVPVCILCNCAVNISLFITFCVKDF